MIAYRYKIILAYVNYVWLLLGLYFKFLVVGNAEHVPIFILH
jgi:hypothetical protein